MVGFHFDAGAPASCDVLDIVVRNLANEIGNVTDKYPLEVLFEHFGLAPGQAVRNFGVGLSVGGGTAMAAFLVAHLCLQDDWRSHLPALVWAEIAPKILRCVCMTGLYDPADDTQGQIFKSVGAKIAAAARQRPSALQLLYSFDRRVSAVLGTGTRL